MGLEVEELILDHAVRHVIWRGEGGGGICDDVEIGVYDDGRGSLLKGFEAGLDDGGILEVVVSAEC